MSIIRVELAEEFMLGDDIVLLAMDGDGVAEFTAALKRAEDQGSWELERGSFSHRFTIRAGQSTVDLQQCDKPDGDLAAAIDDQFGSFDGFRGQFTAAANGLQGSGWAVLGYDSLGDRLLTFQLYDQQANVPLGIIPLLQVDMWEHAYYLQYKNVKADYVKAFWNVVNWADVQSRFAHATVDAKNINTAKDLS